MTIDARGLVGLELEPLETGWTPDDVILYHLSIGAGNPPTDPVELAYTYEEGLQVLPSFATAALHRLLAAQPALAGLPVDPRNVLSLGHELEIPAPLPATARVRLCGKVAAVYDADWAAVVVLEARCEDEQRRELFSDRYSLFLKGEGQNGAPLLPSPVGWRDAGPPDFELEVPTLPQQALLHRLCGDKNALHADPAVARAAGFPRPVLHGLATYGAVCRAVANEVLGARPDRITAYDARFVGVVFPGETLRVLVWQREGELLLEANVVERRSPVLAGGRVRLAELRPSVVREAEPAAAASSAAEIAEFAAKRLAERLGVPLVSIPHHRPLGELGVDSVEAVGLTGELEVWLGCTLPATLLYEYPTLDEVSRFLASRSGTGARTVRLHPGRADEASS
jgi:acyl dehydratase/acyl carrier protein